jgi:pimeloyl-ACP methyl ester carboxylesterase
MATRQVAVPGAELEVVDWGAGEPVVFVQTALVADELLPLAYHAKLAEGYRKILYHRRGYAASSGVSGPGSIVRDAADCRGLLEAFGIPRAHFVGLSLSGAIALQLAAVAPACVHSLTLLEPPPMQTASAPDFRAANDRLLQSRRERGLDAALDEFLGLVIGPRWRAEIEQHVPGAPEQMKRDVRTFFDVDLPALLGWRFERDDAARIGAPVMHIGGSDSGPWFAEVRQLILEWFPHAEDVVIDGADHSLAMTHTPQVAEALDAFLRSHPLGSAPAR